MDSVLVDPRVAVCMQNTTRFAYSQHLLIQGKKQTPPKNSGEETHPQKGGPAATTRAAAGVHPPHSPSGSVPREPEDARAHTEGPTKSRLGDFSSNPKKRAAALNSPLFRAPSYVSAARQVRLVTAGLYIEPTRQESESLLTPCPALTAGDPLSSDPTLEAKLTKAQAEKGNRTPKLPPPRAQVAPGTAAPQAVGIAADEPTVRSGPDRTLTVSGPQGNHWHEAAAQTRQVVRNEDPGQTGGLPRCKPQGNAQWLTWHQPKGGDPHSAH